MHASNALKKCGAQDGGGGQEDAGPLKSERKERGRREEGERKERGGQRGVLAYIVVSGHACCNMGTHILKYEDTQTVV